MCLAVPGRVLSITGHRAEVDFSGVSRQVDLSLLPEVKADDYVSSPCRMRHSDYSSG